jgi:hypothetical protein
MAHMKKNLRIGDYVLDTREEFKNDIGVYTDEGIQWLNGRLKGYISGRSSITFNYIKIISENEALARLI